MKHDIRAGRVYCISGQRYLILEVRPFRMKGERWSTWVSLTLLRPRDLRLFEQHEVDAARLVGVTFSDMTSEETVLFAKAVLAPETVAFKF